MLRTILPLVLLLVGHDTTLGWQEQKPFGIRIVDSRTDRGVPLVELTTTSNLRFVTDSAGYVAITDPALIGRRIFFNVSSHGYEFPKDGFGIRGRAVTIEPGELVEWKIDRINIAERLYRQTGEGIYVDSVLLGRTVPIDEPLLNGGVVGQDSVQTAVVGDTIYWFWGDTSQQAYPLGNFGTSTATSRLPGAGGLDPAQGVNLHYAVSETGFSRPAFKERQGGVVWVDGVAVADNPDGDPQILAHFSRRKSLEQQIDHGVAAFDTSRAQFELLVTLPDSDRRHLQGQVFRMHEQNRDYLVSAVPYPILRVPANREAVLDPEQFEAFTPLRPHPAGESVASRVERDDSGRAVYRWRKGAQPFTADDERQLIADGILSEDEAHWRTVDAASGEAVRLHSGSIRWNEYRNRWVMIAVQQFGGPSFVGEVWYLESARPEGPWQNAVRIITHDRYSFYNPTHHDFFDSEDGRMIFFEGTYTHSFANQPLVTPRYDYNQVMYRLDLADPRLQVAHTD